jgi:hypothetical protein
MLPSVVLISLVGLLPPLSALLPDPGEEILQISYSRSPIPGRISIQEDFSEPLKDQFLRATRPKERAMKDVFLVDRRDPTMTTTIVAREGRIDSREDVKLITVRFFDGTIFMVDKKQEEGRTITFSTYDLGIGLDDIMPALAGREKTTRDVLRGIAERITGPPNKTATPEILSNWRGFSVLCVFHGLIGAPTRSRSRSPCGIVEPTFLPSLLVG